MGRSGFTWTRPQKLRRPSLSSPSALGVPREPCPKCRRPMILLLGPGGGLPPVTTCLDCDKIDPIKSSEIAGWTQSKSLEPPD
jgi:hypothetical protein